MPIYRIVLYRRNKKKISSSFSLSLSLSLSLFILNTLLLPLVAPAALRNTGAFIELNHGGIHSLQIQPRSFGGCDSQAHRYSSIDVNQARRPSSETSGYGVHSPFSSLVFHTLPCFFHFFVCVVISHETKSSTF